MICLIIHEIWTFAIGFVKTRPQHYCSLVMFREVFLRTKFTEKREFEREILRMHEFCVTRNVLP